MIRSMTGYGEASSNDAGAHYFLDVRSLNSKYLKCVIRLPDDLQALEAELEAEMRKRFSRGTVTLTARCSNTSSAAAHEINRDALSRYVDQIKAAAGSAGLDLRLDAGALLSLPGVLQPPQDEEERLHSARAALLGLLDRACRQLVEMRKREGVALHRDLTEHRDLIADRLGRIEQRAPAVVEEYEKRLRTRIETLLADAGRSLEPADLIKEVAVYADRTDIAEEIARLRGHIEQFTDLIGDADARPVGRTLDFLAQEMLREANTIASKSADAAISRDIVEVKGAIDRIKEQVQNVE